MFEGIEETKPDKTLLNDYMLTFSSEAGRRVLADILVNFCWFGQHMEPTDKAVGEHNVGTAILGRLGKKDGKDIANAIMNIPTKD